LLLLLLLRWKKKTDSQENLKRTKENREISD